MEPDMQTLLSQFASLTSQRRRAIYHGILDQLRPDEWREVKDRTSAKNFQCDILGRLPLEASVFIAEHMDLADVVLLRRVSRRWQQVLSSPTVCGAIIRAVSGKQVSNSDFTALIKKRLQMERGQPIAKFPLPSPLSIPYNTLLNICGVDYSHGVYARIEGSNDSTSITLLHHWSGKSIQLTTENREQLVDLRVSKQLVAALSTRAFCHVWHLDTLEHRSFRLPSMRFHHFLVSGLKVVLINDETVTHWGFDTQTVRSVKVGNYIFALALHPLEDQFTIVRISEKHEQNSQEPDDNIHHRYMQGHRIRTERYAPGRSNKFQSIDSHDQPLPSAELDGWYDEKVALKLIDGQSNVMALRHRAASEGSDRGIESHAMLYLALEGDRVTVHSLPILPKDTKISYPAKGLIYASSVSAQELMILGIEKTSTSSIAVSTHTTCPSPPSHTMTYRYSLLRKQPLKDCLQIFSDSNLVLLISKDEVRIWCFEEGWETSRIQAALEH